MCDTTLKISSSKSDVVKIMIPMKDKVGKHKVILKVSDGKRVYRKTKEIEVIQSDIRSIQQISVLGPESIIGVKRKVSTGIKISKR